MHKKITVILFAAAFLFLPLMSFILMPKEPMPFSENENRYLAKFVKPKFFGKNANIADRRFMTAFDEWFSDRFAFREDFIVLKNNTELLTGKTEINGVTAADGRLIQVWRGYDRDLVDRSLKAMDAFAAKYPEKDVYFMLAPTSQEIYADTLPPNFEPGSQKAFIKYCYDNLRNISGIDVLTPLYENRDKYVYYRTDHHWTGGGAYLAYCAACLKMGTLPYEYSWFDIEHASGDFRGTLFSKTLNSRVTPDIISFYTLTSPQPATSPIVKAPDITLTVNTGAEIKKYDSLYFREYLSKKDKYSAYLGDNVPILDITANLENNDNSLLIIKDSYANCMIPFLVNHYKRITVLDMRYINTDIRSLVKLEEYGQALFVFNAVNFSEDKNIVKLNLTK